MSFNEYKFGLNIGANRLREFVKQVDKLPRFFWGRQRDELIYHVNCIADEVEALVDAGNHAAERHEQVKQEIEQERAELSKIRADINELKNQKSELIQKIAIGDLTPLSYDELVELSDSIERFKKNRRSENYTAKTGKRSPPQREDYSDNITFLVALSAFVDSERSANTMHSVSQATSSIVSSSVDSSSSSSSSSSSGGYSGGYCGGSGGSGCE